MKINKETHECHLINNKERKLIFRQASDLCVFIEDFNADLRKSKPIFRNILKTAKRENLFLVSSKKSPEAFDEWWENLPSRSFAVEDFSRIENA